MSKKDYIVVNPNNGGNNSNINLNKEEVYEADFTEVTGNDLEVSEGQTSELRSKANILVMGNSGVGKSTLINSIYKYEENDAARANVGVGKPGTQVMRIHESDNVPFRLIDTKGIEYGIFEQNKTKNQISKWTKEGLRTNDESKKISMVWYCLDGTSKRMFKKNLRMLEAVTKKWADVPIILVITKSYSAYEIEENIKMVEAGVKEYGKGLNIKGIIPVVAQPYVINEQLTIAPYGLDKLMYESNELLPAALQESHEAAIAYNLKLKKKMSNSLVASMTVGAGIVGFVPIPVADSIVLNTMQAGMLTAITNIYDLKLGDDVMKNVMGTVIQCGLVTVAAKTTLSLLKPFFVAADVLNAIVAAAFTAVLGEIYITILDNIARGELDVRNLDKIKQFAESEFAKRLPGYLKMFTENNYKLDKTTIGKIIADMFTKNNK